MSGIVGLYYRDGRPVERATLEAMLAPLAHRGPDGSGLWQAGPVGLGHLMLWTTPESQRERLPLVGPDGHLALVFDGRVDNRAELLAALPLRGQPTDGELILAAYEKWGQSCPQHLKGDFALALWDGRRQRLFCSRDHFGARPFYYYQSDTLFAFASEVKALLSLPELAPRPNEVRVADYLAHLPYDPAITFYRDIVRLPPARWLAVGEGEHTGHTYWSLDPRQEIRLASEAAYAEAFRERLAGAVRRCLRSAYPLGVWLSGGLDSSAITCVSRELLGRAEPLHTFSVVFDSLPQDNERPYIEAVVDRAGTMAHYTPGDSKSPLADLETMLWHQDGPFFNTTMALFWGHCLESARQRQSRVLLNGAGGDQALFVGPEYLVALAARGRWLALLAEGRRLAEHYHRPWWYFPWHYGARAVLLEPPQRAWRWLRRRSGPRKLPALLNPELVERLAYADRFRSMREWVSRPLYSARLAHHRQLVLTGLASEELERLDKAAAAYGLEQRSPFLDRDLVEFCLALPQAQKTSQGWNRWVLRQALADCLPPVVRWRRGKGGFSRNLRRTLLAFERERLDKLILARPGPVADYVDMAVLRRMYRRYHDLGGAEVEAIWRVVALAAWLEQQGYRS